MDRLLPFKGFKITLKTLCCEDTFSHNPKGNEQHPTAKQQPVWVSDVSGGGGGQGGVPSIHAVHSVYCLAAALETASGSATLLTVLLLRRRTCGRRSEVNEAHDEGCSLTLGLV